MGERWSPGGSEWIWVLDYGSAAMWVRPDYAGASIAVYLGGYYDDTTADIWVVHVRRGSGLLDLLMDKVHRVRWVEDQDPDDWYKVTSFEHWRAPVSHRGHPRCNHNRHVWLDPLPRRVREALGYPSKTQLSKPGRLVYHTPVWVSAQIPVDAEGNTRPGFQSVTRCSCRRSGRPCPSFSAMTWKTRRQGWGRSTRNSAWRMTRCCGWWAGRWVSPETRSDFFRS